MSRRYPGQMVRSPARSPVRPIARAVTGISADALSAYAANGFDPEMYADFTGSLNGGTPLYRKQGATCTLADFGFPERSGLATMTDSDGLVKWGAHNFIPYSGDVGNASGWSGVSATESAGVITSGAGTGRHSWDTSARVTPDQTELTSVIKVTPGTHDFVQVTVSAGTGAYITAVCDLSGVGAVGETASAGGTVSGSSVTAVGDGSFLCTVSGIINSGALDAVVSAAFAEAASGNTFLGGGYSGWQTAAAGTETFTLHAAWAYRSDLGGMVDVPSSYRAVSALNKYLPTTTAARYLPRFNDYVYDGSSFVDSGPLIERVARTNLDPNSDDLSAWTTSNTTIAKDQTGADGVANSAHSITAGANNGTALEQITASSADHVWGCLMKRVTGSGTVEVTVNGGSTWVDVTSDINSSEFVQVDTGAGVTVTNPEFGVRLGTSGDVVAVQVSQLEQTSGRISSPIPTNGSSVARTADPALTIAAADAPYSASGLSLAVIGDVTYADEDELATTFFANRAVDGTNFIRIGLDTRGADTGQPVLQQFLSATGATVLAETDAISPGVGVAFALASRNAPSVQNIAVGGAASTLDTTASTYPDLSSTDLDLAGANFMGHISRIVGWAEDIGEAGIEQAATEDNTAP